MLIGLFQIQSNRDHRLTFRRVIIEKWMYIAQVLYNALVLSNICEYRHKWYETQPRLWLAAVSQPKSTHKVPHYPHNYHAIPVFVHRIGLPFASHCQHSFVQNTAPKFLIRCVRSMLSVRTLKKHFLNCVATVDSPAVMYKTVGEGRFHVYLPAC